MQTLAGRSLLLLGLSVVLLLALTAFESALVGLSTGAERVVTFLLLVCPAAIGALLGGLSLLRREGRAGQAVAGIVLNTLFAAFHLLIILFAG